LTAEAGSLDFLRELAARQGIDPDDADLEAVGFFLETILPALEELETLLRPAGPA
jgi:hypothetical protein